MPPPVFYKAQTPPSTQMQPPSAPASASTESPPSPAPVALVPSTICVAVLVLVAALAVPVCVVLARFFPGALAAVAPARWASLMPATWTAWPCASACILTLGLVVAIAGHLGRGAHLGLVDGAGAAASATALPTWAAALAAVHSLSFERLLHVAAASGAVGYSYESLVPFVQLLGLLWALRPLMSSVLAPKVKPVACPEGSGPSKHFDAFNAGNAATSAARRSPAEGAVSDSCAERAAQREVRARAARR